MKKTQELLGLPVIEVSSGNQLGKVGGVVVNPDQGSVESLLLDRDKWYGEMRSLPYGSVLGVGEFAVTVLNDSDVVPVSASPSLSAILERDVPVIGAGVMTKSGKYIGKVPEYVMDDQSGKIVGCLVEDGNGDEFIVPGEKVLTYGSKFLIIDDGYESYTVKELSDSRASAPAKKETPRQPQTQTQARAEGLKNKGPVDDPVEIFEARQRQYLAGKKATKKIVGTGGQVIVEEGTVVTEEIIEKALAQDKYIELTMNVAD